MTQRYFDRNEALRAARSARLAGRLHDGVFFTPDWEAELAMEDELGYRFIDLSNVLNNIGMKFVVSFDPAYRAFSDAVEKIGSVFHHSGGAMDFNGKPLDGVKSIEMKGMHPHVVTRDEAFPSLRQMIERYSAVVMPDGAVLSDNPALATKACPGVDIRSWMDRAQP